MNLDHVSSLFDPIDKLRPPNFSRELSNDLVRLIHPHKGYPNMRALLSAVSTASTTRIKIFPPFLEIAGDSKFEF